MASYDFQSLLSAIDFEHLVRDLLSKELNLDLTAFAEGKDGGTDLRYSIDEKKSVIVQCKRMKSVSTKIIDEEYEKVKKINPKTYYFVCSNDLSVAKFDYIKDKFKKWMKGKDDFIYSKNKLNSLLDKHFDVHQKNYKLWLNSSEIFNTLINQPLYQRAKSLISDIQRNNIYYVRNESLNKAIDILNSNQFVIISGIPGIGKSTLAKLILWEYLQKEFEVIEIRKVIEGEQFLIEDSENKQVFYYDDFLGENFLKYDVIEGRANDLVQFINRIKNSTNKVLIMTTREYILNQAKETYEKLDSTELNLAKHTLDLSSYSKKIKALILYNHLFYSKIPIEYIEKLLENQSYATIINHKNYSPRIIEQLTVKLTDVPIENYVNEFIESLDKPLGIWNKAFNSQISQGSKIILYLLMSTSGPMTLEDFKILIQSTIKTTPKPLGYECNLIDLKNYLKELESSFIKIGITDKKNHYIDFLNPSIKDYMLTTINEDKLVIKFLLTSCIYFNQFVYTVRYLSANFLLDEEILSLIDSKILGEWDILVQPSRIFSSQMEYRFEIDEMTKIDGLKFYIAITKNSDVTQFIINKFKNIHLRQLSYYDERRYIEFYIQHKALIKITYKKVLEQIIENISFFESVKNLFLLKEVNKPVFKKFLEDNNEVFNDKFNDSVIREIELIDSENNLSYFKDVTLAELNLSEYSISLNEFESYFSEKEKKIIDKKMNSNDNSNIEIENKVVNDEYNIEELFKIEMFH